MDQQQKISARARIWLWIAAWAAAALATAIPDPSVLMCAFLFPAGLIEFIPFDLVPPFLEPPDSGYLFFASVCIMYIGLSIVGLLQSRRLYYFLIYAVLCVILAVNVIGCHVQINRGIHT